MSRQVRFTAVLKYITLALVSHAWKKREKAPQIITWFKLFLRGQSNGKCASCTYQKIQFSWLVFHRMVLSSYNFTTDDTVILSIKILNKNLQIPLIFRKITHILCHITEITSRPPFFLLFGDLSPRTPFLQETDYPLIKCVGSCHSCKCATPLYLLALSNLFC